MTGAIVLREADLFHERVYVTPTRLVINVSFNEPSYLHNGGEDTDLDTSDLHNGGEDNAIAMAPVHVSGF
jgi:hypothetical protein